MLPNMTVDPEDQRTLGRRLDGVNLIQVRFLCAHIWAVCVCVCVCACVCFFKTILVFLT